MAPTVRELIKISVERWHYVVSVLIANMARGLNPWLRWPDDESDKENHPINYGKVG